MIARTFQNASGFLERTQDVLVANEAANSLMLGVCLRLQSFPERITSRPFFMTVEDEEGLAVGAVMTPPHKVILCSDRQELDTAVEMVVRGLLAHRWNVPGVLGPLHVARAFAEIWAYLSGEEYREGARQRIYELRQVPPPQAADGRLRVATEDDLELLARWVCGFSSDVFAEGDLTNARETVESRVRYGEIYVWEDERPVSMAAKTRPTLNGISVSLVYTPPEFRGRGYATACVGSLSRLLLESGWKFCALFADLSNPTANHVYQSIGYQPVCDFDEFIFHAAA